MSTVAVSTFLSTLRRSNLLKPEQIAYANDLATRCDAAEIAKDLLKRKWLTEWQTHQLLSGKSRLFLGKYKLLDVLGAGGMGAVFKAESATTLRPVALKVLAASLNDSDVARARFEREIRASAQVNHPNIVRAIDADRFGNRVFLVMEYFEGPDLKALIKQHRKLPTDFACECIRQAALGLQHAHEQGLVHRDIKPSNILVTKVPETDAPLVKVLDLGLARISSDSSSSGDMTRVGQIMGSPDYMSPEQAMDSKSADHRSDIYSLGVTLFHLIAGELPYDGDNVMEKLLSRINVDAPPLSRYCADAPPVLVHILSRMLHRDPAQRFQSAGEVAAILATFVADPGALESLLAPKPTATFELPTINTAGDATLNQIDAILDSRANPTPLSQRPRRRSSKTTMPLVLSVGTALLLTGGLLIAGLGSNGETSNAGSADSQAENEEPAASNQPASKAAPPARLDSPDDVVTRWSITMNRPAVILVDGEERSVRKLIDLPDHEYQLLDVDLSGARRLSSSVLKQLASLKSLRSLSLAGAQLSDRQFALLGQLKQLESLDVSNTGVTAPCIRTISGMPELRELSLRYLPLGNAEASTLAALSQLATLDVTGADFTDRGLQELASIESLKMLRVRHTGATNDGLKRLRRLHPDLTVE